MKLDGFVHLLCNGKLGKNHFVNDELQPSAATTFECCSCFSCNRINIVPHQTGFGFAHVYELGYISEEQILSNGLAQEASSNYSFLGKYLVWNLPTLYFKTSCQKCHKQYIVVFGLGESQPSKWVCKISGVWQIEALSSLSVG